MHGKARVGQRMDFMPVLRSRHSAVPLHLLRRFPFFGWLVIRPVALALKRIQAITSLNDNDLYNVYLPVHEVMNGICLRYYDVGQVSQLRQMPEGAGEIATTLVSVDKTKDIVERLKGRESTDEKARRQAFLLRLLNRGEGV